MSCSTGRVVNLGPEAPAADPAEDLVDLASLPFDATDRLIGRWNEARRERDEAYRLVGTHRGLDAWVDLANRAVIDAERRLITAILAWDDDFHGERTSRPTSWLWPARGVRSNGLVYVAAPDLTREGERGGDGIDRMLLVVVPESGIADLDATPDPSRFEPAHAVEPEATVPAADDDRPLTATERTILATARTIGGREALRRILQADPYSPDCDRPTAPAVEMDAAAGAQPQEASR